MTKHNPDTCALRVLHLRKQSLDTDVSEMINMFSTRWGAKEGPVQRDSELLLSEVIHAIELQSRRNHEMLQRAQLACMHCETYCREFHQVRDQSQNIVKKVSDQRHQHSQWAEDDISYQRAQVDHSIAALRLQIARAQEEHRRSVHMLMEAEESLESIRTASPEWLLRGAELAAAEEHLSVLLGQAAAKRLERDELERERAALFSTLRLDQEVGESPYPADGTVVPGSSKPPAPPESA
eukprot:gnl/Trimastix_PCT/2226.p1 GENE.gnl/Trimastix_PCT/2226~~gnl/Trimastix_PCT/2226.p1  ORF type:complete len:238 (-),score=10.74 gnl/Trimastix_PCT/2226:44-757(-)